MAQKSCDRDSSRDTNRKMAKNPLFFQNGAFGVSTAISDYVIATNPKMAQKEKIHGSFRGFYHVNCLCYSLFGAFWRRFCFKLQFFLTSKGKTADLHLFVFI